LDNKYNDTGGTIDGNVDITGNLLVGATNIITELGNKYDDTGGTIDGNVDITGNLLVGATNIITELGNKVDDTGGTIDGNVDITGNLLVGTTNIINEIGTKQDEITTSTDLSCNSLTTTGNATIGGSLSHKNDYAHFYIEADQTMGTSTDTSYTIRNYLNGSTIGNAISIGSTDGTTNNDLFIAQKSGYFKVNASFNYFNSLNSHRLSVRTQLYKNNLYVDGNGEGYAYIRNLEGRNGSNVINSIIQLNIDDSVRAVVSVTQGTFSGFTNQTNHLNLVSASVVFEFIGE